MVLNQNDLRLVGFWVADCAERVLPLFEAKAPADARPREAIADIRAISRGEKRSANLCSLAVAAHAAAREAGDPGAGDEEIGWAIGHASPSVREVVQRWPARGPGRSRMDALY
jgi:hypothetical protein